jgi:hypothetical protein
MQPRTLGLLESICRGFAILLFPFRLRRYSLLFFLMSRAAILTQMHFSRSRISSCSGVEGVTRGNEAVFQFRYFDFKGNPLLFGRRQFREDFLDSEIGGSRIFVVPPADFSRLRHAGDIKECQRHCEVRHQELDADPV